MNTVHCRTCVKWTPNAINPEHGMGICALGIEHWRNQRAPGGGRAAPPYPYAHRICDKHERKTP